MRNDDQMRRSRAGRWWAAAAGCLAAAALLATSATAAAQGAATDGKAEKKKKRDDETGKMGGEHRVLNDHPFITPTLAYSAMMNASFSFRQGGGVYMFEGTNAFSGQPQPASLFLYGQQFLVQIGILNRVALDLTFGGTAAVGGDLDTLVVVGALAFLNVGGMPRVRIWTFDKIGLQISAGVGVYYDRFLNVSPGTALTRAAQTGSVKDIGKDLFRQAEALSVVPALMVAEGVGPFGAQLSVAPRIGVAGDAKYTSLATALHLNLDLRRVTPVPFAVTAEYEAIYDFDTSQVTHTVAPGLFYTGRRDFSVGAVAVVVPPKNKETFIQAQLAMQYFF